MSLKYVVETDPETMAKALGRDLPISRKHAVEICRAIKGMDLEKAEEYLENVIKLKQPVPFKRYNRMVAHRKGKGFGPGKYPVKAAKYILKVLKDAESNAEYSGLDTDRLYIYHISSHKGRTYEGWMPRAHGRATPWNQETVNIQVVLKEREEE
ncbi:MAG: 50S ribosomal protein L22 [Thermoplasmata archaeon]|nr:MAG: 50S ribosomal protein L22 [Thermoplasmata archaeon]HDD59885.1 50S ribosomal protein L22 [Euryarchaeota archaeon]RLF71187.1 MAG: 50S ribosomal protein L22 [Thermoplasmata archaeon]RLF72250.1 MAG: 50S ribosomal protein L22 [Thermoplasmata archaeon]RLF74392.1 MAG: 50S ribosomal protein L22 [Thermoplasmata archaeon]